MAFELPATRPLLRWAGSKKRQFSQVRRYFPSHFERYIEPFAGSAAFFFQMRPLCALLNDVNTNLTSFYQDVTKKPEAVYAAFVSHQRNRETYNTVRSAFNSMPPSIEKSGMFYYLNRNSFNGIYRENTRGQYNVPFSSSRVPRYPTSDEFFASAKALSVTTVDNFDFQLFCERHCAANDFVYMDPPFYSNASRIFNEYNAMPFSNADVERLLILAVDLDTVGCKVMISYNESIIRRLTKRRHWHEAELKIIRTVAGGAKGGTYSSEKVLFNYAP